VRTILAAPLWRRIHSLAAPSGSVSSPRNSAAHHDAYRPMHRAQSPPSRAPEGDARRDEEEACNRRPTSTPARPCDAVEQSQR